MARLASEPNVFKTATGNPFVLCYVDDLLFLCEQTVHRHAATSSPTSNRRFGSRQHSQLPRQERHQQGWLLRSLPGRQLHHRTAQRSRHEQLQTSTGTRNKDRQDRSWASTQCWRTFSRQKSSWQTAMDDIHKTRHQLRNKGTSKVLDRADNSRPTKVEASTEIHQRSTTLQVLHTTNSEHNRNKSRHRSLCRQRLGRMRNNTEVNNRLRHQVHGSNNTVRKPHTGSNSTQQRRSRTLRLQHRSNRSTTHSKLFDGIAQQEEGQHQDLHGFFEWKEHGNKDWIIKEGQIHRAEAPFHPTVGAQRHRANHQGQHAGEPCRHLHQVRCNRDALEASQWGWDHTQPYLATAEQA